MKIDESTRIKLKESEAGVAEQAAIEQGRAEVDDEAGKLDQSKVEQSSSSTVNHEPLEHSEFAIPGDALGHASQSGVGLGGVVNPTYQSDGGMVDCFGDSVFQRPLPMTQMERRGVAMTKMAWNLVRTQELS